MQSAHRSLEGPFHLLPKMDPWSNPCHVESFALRRECLSQASSWSLLRLRAKSSRTLPTCPATSVSLPRDQQRKDCWCKSCPSLGSASHSEQWEQLRGALTRPLAPNFCFPRNVTPPKPFSMSLHLSSTCQTEQFQEGRGMII